jgi:hypothetical protein
MAVSVLKIAVVIVLVIPGRNASPTGLVEEAAV